MSAESLFPESLSPESLSPESPPLESLSPEPVSAEPAALEPMSPEPMSPEPMSPEPMSPESLPSESLSPESLPSESLPSESLSPESLSPESLPSESLPSESLPSESLSTDASTQTLLIIWHSRTGAAQQMAAAAANGAHTIAAELQADTRLHVRLLAADTVQPDDLLGAAGYVFAAPENLAALSGAMKECLDRNYYPVLDRLNGRPYGLIITAGSDGDGARRQLERICTGWRLQRIAPALIVPMHAQTPEAILAPKTVPDDWLARGAELGGTLAALLL